jgi:3-deoxy-D-manno-octulosonic-acid transferase
MYFIYSLLLTVGFVLLLPRFLLDAMRSGKYVTGLRQRLGNIPKINSNGKRVVWLHCVSVGEARAAQSLVRELKNKFPNLVLVVSTTTVTGQNLAREIFRDHAAAVFYFPIDWAWTVRRTLRAIQPSAVLVMETEIWPRLFREARKRNVPVALLNGRISEKSFRRYKLVRPFIARALSDLTFASMQTESDATRIAQLGLPSQQLRVSGNLKFDSAAASIDENRTSEIRSRFGFNGSRPLIVAASTHDSEEAVLVEAFRQIRQQHPDARLVIAPRHPERFESVASLLANCGFKFARRSAATSPDDTDADIILLDSIGELTAVYSLAAVAFVGGSIAPHGGHSVIEPAAFGVCTITGWHTHNFAAVTKALLDEGGLIQLAHTVEPATEIARTTNQLLSDNTRREEIGRRAQAVCEAGKGATNRTLDMIAGLLTAPPAHPENGLSFSPLHAAASK